MPRVVRYTEGRSVDNIYNSEINYLTTWLWSWQGWKYPLLMKCEPGRMKKNMNFSFPISSVHRTSKYFEIFSGLHYSFYYMHTFFFFKQQCLHPFLLLIHTCNMQSIMYVSILTWIIIWYKMLMKWVQETVIKRTFCKFYNLFLNRLHKILYHTTRFFYYITKHTNRKQLVLT